MRRRYWVTAAVIVVAAISVHGPLAAAQDEGGADVSVQLTASAVHARPGQRITYVATMRNRGDDAARAAELLLGAEFAPQDLHGRQALPKLVSTTVTQGACTRPDLRQGFFFHCKLGTIAAGKKVVVRFVVLGDAPPSCAIRGKAKTGARSCNLIMAAAIRWHFGPNDKPQSPGRSVCTVSFTPAPRPKPLGCDFPTDIPLPRTRACYSLQIRASQDYVYTQRVDLRAELGCPGAPVIEARVVQRVEIASEEQSVKVLGNFPSLATTSDGMA